MANTITIKEQPGEYGVPTYSALDWKGQRIDVQHDTSQPQLHAFCLDHGIVKPYPVAYHGEGLSQDDRNAINLIIFRSFRQVSFEGKNDGGSIFSALVNMRNATLHFDQSAPASSSVNDLICTRLKTQGLGL